MGFGGCVEKCVGFVCVLFKVVKNLKSIYVKKCPGFPYYTLLALLFLLSTLTR